MTVSLRSSGTTVPVGTPPRKGLVAIPVSDVIVDVEGVDGVDGMVLRDVDVRVGCVGCVGCVGGAWAAARTTASRMESGIRIG